MKLPWLITGALAAFLIAAFVFNPAAAMRDALTDVEVKVGVVETREVSLGVCQDTRTQLFLVETAYGPHYEATFDSPEVRYDLTWQVGGTSVAVEELRGAREELWAEQIGVEFWECVKSRDADVKKKVLVH